MDCGIKPADMMRTNAALACTLALALLGAACSDDPSPADTGGTPVDGGTSLDAVVIDTGTEVDSGFEPDASFEPDSGVEPDAGMGLLQQMDPGSYVQVTEGRIEIGDSFATVKQKLGPGQRTPVMNARSYDWALSGRVELTIWFANTNLDDDDGAPNDVDDTDLVLWIAVKGAFLGATSRGIGLGSTRAEVEAAAPSGYGPPPHTATLTDPEGTLAQYFTTGFLVTYGTDGSIRTFTICRAYPQAPDGELKPDSGEVDFGATSIVGSVLQGTRLSDVTTLLGTADAIGEVTIADNMLKLASYGFLGIEVFAIPSGSERTVFMNVHAPFYGTISGSAGVGSTRAEVEAALGRGPGQVSAMNGNFVCYEGGSSPDIAVTYSEDAVPSATSFTIPLIRTPSSTTCP